MDRDAAREGRHLVVLCAGRHQEVARCVLGDDCLFDKIEYATFRRDATDIFCWAWMWNPDFLHRTKRMTIFPSGVG